MPLRSLGLRATTLAAVTLTAAAALTTVPAAALDGPPGNHTAQSQQVPQDQQAPPAQQSQSAPQTQKQTQDQAQPSAGQYKGRVIARSGLYLRDKPTRGSRVIGLKKYGSIVHIFCKTRGDNVGGNNRWYLLTDGTWAWGSAKYISNIGAAPRWC
ncbi:SH3 domain-containing protein [Streptomyces sp. 8L]|uniref:SH3 domain-containing protein n=1 Tax=Streptomyces sp. 8L TaxID=2877242 RepID=UPI001CD6D610|nr:SH3 domain-containing protein [Streptomyces sp. 8L]MCA1222349.1 SH3 domain-containing protein [Streptomyces sp. 8L]